MRITRTFFSDSPAGRVDRYCLENGEMQVSVLTWGGTLQSIRYKQTDVLLGFSDLAGYQSSTCYYGALIGRCCNRMDHLQIGAHAYPITLNENGQTHLHGGFCGFDKKIWDARVEDGALVLSCRSEDGEEGYPGNLSVTVRYTVEPDGLRIDYSALSDMDTAVNLTSHGYFNLDGMGGDVLEHTLFLSADRISICDEKHIPTGRYLPVTDTPFDFNRPKPIGRDLHASHPQLTPWGGYDNNFMLKKTPGMPDAIVCGKKLRMELFTDQPCVQLYTANDRHDEPMIGMEKQIRHRAFCLETQCEPNAVHFGGSICRAGVPYQTTTFYRFASVE